MPTIDLPNNSTNSTGVGNMSSATQTFTNPITNNNPDPWLVTIGGNNFGLGSNNTNTTTPEKNLKPNEKVEMIEKLYEEVLGRKADTRDVNYYKYSTLGIDQIREQLILSKEHKELIQDGREYKKMKDRAISAEARVRMLENQIRDQVAEFQQLTNLLKEKNRHIRALREQNSGIYNISNSTESCHPKELSNDINGSVYNAPESKEVSNMRDEKVGIVDIIKSLLP